MMRPVASQAQVAVINGFSSHVVPRPADWGEQVHITGWWYPQDSAWQPPDDLLRFLAAGRPPVFVGFGSMLVPDTGRTTATIIEAIQLSGQRAILHAGWAFLAAYRSANGTGVQRRQGWPQARPDVRWNDVLGVTGEEAN